MAARLFLSYSRRDSALAESVADDLRRRGFKVFIDTAEIDPGENFVNRLSSELRRTTGVVAVISESYLASRWGQAELYYAVSTGKVVIPLVIPPASISGLDQPLERLLRDTQFVVRPEGSERMDNVLLGNLLLRAQRRYRRQAALRVLTLAIPALLLALATWWGVAHLNERELNARRERVIQEVTQASEVLQAERVQGLAAGIAEDRRLIGELLLIANDPAQNEVARFNSLALSGEMLRGHRVWRRYIKDLDLDDVSVEGAALVDTTFISGSWQSVRFRDSTFSGVVWVGDKGLGLSNVTFDKVKFHGSQIDAVNAVNVSFLNSKFRGTAVDTTNFAKVRFVTERPPEEGNPTITPEYTLFEQSTLISRRTPPEPHVLDLSEPEDDVIFEDVVFVDCRLEGWFRPEWFRNSSFERCELPPSLSRKELERLGNTFS